MENAVAYGNTAGIVANQNYMGNSSNIVNVNKVTLDEVKIYGQRAVAGVSANAHAQTNNVTINNCIMSNKFDGAQVNMTRIGGVIGESDMSSYSQTSIENTIVTGTTIESSNGFVAAITVDMSGKIIDCIVRDSFLINGGVGNSLGGIVHTNLRGYNTNTTSSIENCTLDNTQVTGFSGYSQGLIVGYTSGDLINNKVINNSKFVKPESASSSNSQAVGGIVGVAMNNGIIENCEVNNFTIDGAVKFGGIVGFTENSITGNKVKNITATNIVDGAGGIVALANNNASVQNNIAEDIKISIIEGNTNANTYIGGIAGGTGRGDVKENKVNSAVLSSPGSIGGIVGVFQTGKELSDNVAAGIDISNGQLSGGIAGTIGGSSVTIDNNIVKPNIKDIDGEKNTEYSSVMSTKSASGWSKPQTGGIIGVVTTSSSNRISNCQVLNTTVEGIGNTGGIVGCSGTALSNNKVENSTIIGETTGSNSTSSDYTGGIIGLGNCSISNCDIKGTSISSNSFYTGGIAGFVNGSVTDCDVSGKSKIENTKTDGQTYMAATGAIVGQSGSGTISNCTSNGTIISGPGRVGAIAGFSNSVISGNTSTDDIVTNTYEIEEYSSMYMPVAGGIIGFATANVNNNNINNTIVNGEGRVGGISGFSMSNVCENIATGVTVNNNSDITKLTEGDRSNIPSTGGITALANGNLLDNIVNNVTINGAGDVGGITGLVVDNASVTGNIVKNNTKIKNTKGSSLMLHTGGIAGIIATAYGPAISRMIFEDNNVIDSSITSSNNYTGGLVGFSIATINSSNVTNVTITQTSGKGLGGLVGYGCAYTSDKYPYTKIEGCELTNVVLNGENETDIVCPIQGAVITDIIVDGEAYVSATEQAMMANEEPIDEEQDIEEAVETSSDDASKNSDLKQTNSKQEVQKDKIEETEEKTEDDTEELTEDEATKEDIQDEGLEDKKDEELKDKEDEVEDPTEDEKQEDSNADTTTDKQEENSDLDTSNESEETSSEEKLALENE